MSVRGELDPVDQPGGEILHELLAHPASREPTRKDGISLVSASTAVNVQTSP